MVLADFWIPATASWRAFELISSRLSTAFASCPLSACAYIPRVTLGSDCPRRAATVAWETLLLRRGIGHSIPLLAQRPGVGVMSSSYQGGPWRASLGPVFPSQDGTLTLIRVIKCVVPNKRRRPCGRGANMTVRTIITTGDTGGCWTSSGIKVSTPNKRSGSCWSGSNIAIGAIVDAYRTCVVSCIEIVVVNESACRHRHQITIGPVVPTACQWTTITGQGSMVKITRVNKSRCSGGRGINETIR